MPPDEPLVCRSSDGRRLVVSGADARARALGVQPGMPLAQARAMLPGLVVHEADVAGDSAALARLAGWCLRIAPLTAADAPDGIWIDATGAAHLHGGEAPMLATLVRRLRRRGICVRAAVADTPGAAHAVARHHPGAVAVVPPGEQEAWLRDLPAEALRLPDGMAPPLRQLGFTRIGQLMDAPRAPLVRRFGPAVALRLDQALGHAAEPIRPVIPPGVIGHRLAFVEPLATAESFRLAIAELVRAVCVHLEETGQGARRLDLLFERVDGAVQAISIGTARPVRGDAHLARLLGEKIETVDPGLGVDAMHLLVPLAERLQPSQASALVSREAEADLSVLVDRLENRLGQGRVWRPAVVESDVPERSLRAIPPLAPATGAGWPAALPRPVRLLHPPQQVQAMAALPDQPPAFFVWRGHRHRVRQADGPERIHGEWWRRVGETAAVRDYFAVEDDDGRRFWLFRRGDGEDAATGDLSWYLHGLF